MGWKGIVGSSFDGHEFDSYCKSLAWVAWRPSYVVLHHTGSPTLAESPTGITPLHIDTFQRRYRLQRRVAGPHLFVDDRRIWVFTPLTLSGVHSPSYNHLALGIEMLGDFNSESFTSGRGAHVRSNTVVAIATLCAAVGIDPANILLHRDDPLAARKDCPGTNVDRLDVVNAVRHFLVEHHGAEHLDDYLSGRGGDTIEWELPGMVAQPDYQPPKPPQPNGKKSRDSRRQRRSPMR